MLKNHGIYISRKDMFDHDLQFFVHGFEFDAGRVVRYEIEVTPTVTRDWRFKVADLRRLPFRCSVRNFSQTYETVEFETSDSPDANFPFWTTWIGKIQDQGSKVAFKIINRDYTDIDGVYEFVSHETVDHIPK